MPDIMLESVIHNLTNRGDVEHSTSPLLAFLAMLNLLLMALLTVVLNGCQIIPTPPTAALVIKNSGPREIIRAVGYGTMGSETAYSSTQREFVAKRASKVDAYRNLAEMIHGLQISGGTTIAEMALTNDSIKSYVSGYINGAREISSEKIVDRNGDVVYETVLEITLSHEFFTYMLPPAHGTGTCEKILAQPDPCQPCDLAGMGRGCRMEDKYYYISY